MPAHFGESKCDYDFVVPEISGIPSRGWSAHTRGYVVYTSRAVRTGIKRGTFLHRLVIETLLGRSFAGLGPGLEALGPKETVIEWHVHHMDFNKRHNCPCNLLLLDSRLHNTAGQTLRDPYTGAFLTKHEYINRYGSPYAEEVPF